jgi:hypothetical protein
VPPAVVLLLVAVAGRAEEAGSPAPPPLPTRLADTGWRDGPATFAPQYPLWSDGATKRRWLTLPEGTAVDASDPDAWAFPRGTRFWKEFVVDSARVETRFIERLPDGTWRYATYAWDAEGREAELVPDGGGVATLADGRRYPLPSRDDCRACHEGGAVPVLGFSALQLSGDRDPHAMHAEPSDADLRTLAARGVLRNLPAALLETPPRIAAASPLERAALGYLHGNCANCHNASDAGVPVGLDLQQRVAPAADDAVPHAGGLVAASRSRVPGVPAATRWVEPGAPDRSVLALRMRSRDPYRRMPPVGTQHADPLGVEQIEAWIASLPTHEETTK